MNRNRSKIALAFVLAVACVVSAGAAVAESKDQSNAALAFDKLKSLVGQWEGTTDKGKVTTTYELVAGGSASWSGSTWAAMAKCRPSTISTAIA
jgi:hypothetical protein